MNLTTHHTRLGREPFVVYEPPFIVEEYTRYRVINRLTGHTVDDGYDTPDAAQDLANNCIQEYEGEEQF
jgi:hypothetical protein